MVSAMQYYGSRLESTCDLQTSAACSLPCRPMPKSAIEALNLVHPEVTKRFSRHSYPERLSYCSHLKIARFFGCGLPVPEKLQGCRILDLGSGSGRDCYALSKLVGETGHVTGIDMTEELILVSRKYISYHQEKFGFEKPNTTFLQGYMEKLTAAGVENDSMDIIVSNCVICLCPDKKTVLREAYKVLKEGGELYYSDMYASNVVPDHLKEDSVLWGEGMGGSLYWRDFISLVQEVGFSTPHLISASHIEVHNCELKKKAGDISYASGTYRLFKLPKKLEMSSGIVTYKGTVPDYPCQLEFDSSHCFKKDVALQVDGEMAAILQCSRFSPDFCIQKYGHLSPFLLADNLGSSVKQCSKTGKAPGGCGET
ncbi:arsenite methyltransferase isoform X3 [Oncorhynchus tshawytscha]|uniref:arsenite methyltransferase isoform X3 n=1 Tax=Oncorhynchus tshawytscha TaxID=74940 RepID=UPI000D0A6415|nr:arsenite methyltransferase isoform X3 [Oncorhynchus tshawytscha]